MIKKTVVNIQMKRKWRTNDGLRQKTMNGSMTTARQIKKRTMGGHITIFRRQMDTVMDRATMDGQTSDNG